MASQMIFRDCSRGLKEEAQEYWGRKAPRLDRLLQRIPADQRHLRVTISRQNGRFGARAVLTLPTGTLVADQDGQTYREAMDKAVDRLVAEARKHMGQLRRGQTDRRQQRRQTDWAAIGRSLAEHRQRQQREVFFELLRPAMRILRDHARRELILAQIEGVIRPGETTVGDLVDEVMVRAWDRFDNRPAGQSLETWLTQLFHKVLDGLAKAEAEAAVPLDAPIPQDDARFEAQDGRAEENDPYWSASEPVRYEDVLPAEAVPELVAGAEPGDQQRWIFQQLRGLPRRQRRAFTLHVLDNWEPHEIAVVQRRSVAGVETDIAAVGEFLRGRLLPTP